MIIIKSENDLKDIKQAGLIWRKTKAYILELLNKNPYRSLNQLDKLIDKFIVQEGGTSTFLGMYGFPKHVCISVNDTIIHGIPNDYVLKDEDKVTFDIGVTYNNHICDAAFIYLMPKCPKEQVEIAKVCEESLLLALKEVKPGNHTGDIGFVIENYIKNKGYYLLEGFSGHGCGNKLHEDPIINNYGKPHTGAILKKNMVICIEPMILAKGKEYYIKNDWDVIAINHHETAHCEDMILVTDDGYEILN